MKRGVTAYKCLLGIGLLYFFGLLPYAQGIAAVTDQEIAVTSQGIYIQLHERTLGAVLAHIQQVSGIRFSFPTAMRSTPITATIHTRDWPSAVRELLRPFSTAEVWDGIQLKVFLFEQGQPDTSAPNVATEPQESDARKPTEADAESPPPAVLLPPLPPPPPPAVIKIP
jgi:hypothetical protein